MTKSNITEYDNTADNNTDVEDVPLGENLMYPSHVNNAFREIMADLADINDGTVAMTSPSAVSLDVTNNITVGGTVDGRDVATDGTKLDGIEAGATNVSSLTDLSITDGTDGQVLTTDGAGGFAFEDAAGGSSDADTLDGLDSTQFLRSDASDTFAGTLTLDGSVIIQNDGVSGQGDNNTHFNYQGTGVNYIRGVTTNFNGTTVNCNARIEMSNVLDMNNYDIYGVDQMFHHGDTNTYMQFHASDQWRVVTGGSERFEINNSGFRARGKEAFFARAWVNFQGNGTVTIRDDGAVSSISDYGIGYYGINFSTAFEDDDYSAVITGGVTVSSTYRATTCCFGTGSSLFNYSTTQCRFKMVGTNAGGTRDSLVCSAAFFR